MLLYCFYWDSIHSIAERTAEGGIGLFARAPSLLIDGLGRKPDRREKAPQVLKYKKRERGEADSSEHRRYSGVQRSDVQGSTEHNNPTD